MTDTLFGYAVRLQVQVDGAWHDIPTWRAHDRLDTRRIAQRIEALDNAADRLTDDP